MISNVSSARARHGQPRGKGRPVDRNGALGADVEAGRVEHLVQGADGRVRDVGRDLGVDRCRRGGEVDRQVAGEERVLQGGAHRFDVDSGTVDRGRGDVAGRCGVERDGRVGGVDVQAGDRCAQRRDGGRGVDGDLGVHRRGEPGAEVPCGVRGEGLVHQRAGIDRGSEIGAGDGGIGAGSGEDDGGVGEMLLHGLDGRARGESADGDAGHRGAGGDQDERGDAEPDRDDRDGNRDPQPEPATARGRLGRRPLVGGRRGIGAIVERFRRIDNRLDLAVDGRLVGAGPGRQICHAITPRLLNTSPNA